MLWCELSDAEALPLARRAGWQVFCLLTGFWQELADICLGQAVRQHNGLFKSAFLHWNVSIYPSSTCLDKCPAHPTVIGLACFRMLDSNSSYQTWETCQFLLDISFWVSFMCEEKVMQLYDHLCLYGIFQNLDFIFLASHHLNMCQSLKISFALAWHKLNLFFSYRTHSKNLACKIFKLAFLTLGLDPPLGSEDFYTY